MKFSIGLLTGVAALLSAAHATVITNGDFEAGDTSGFDVAACGGAVTMMDDPVCGFTNVIDPSGFITVEQDGTNNFLQLDSSLGTQILLGLLTQTLNITADANILSFDAGVLDVLPGLGNETFPDFVLVSVRTEMGELLPIFSMSDQFGFAVSDNALNASLTSPSDGFFGTGVIADLSSLVGMSIILEISLNSTLDGQRTLFALDNFSLTGGDVSDVPIPAPLALFATGLFLLRRVSSQRAM